MIALLLFLLLQTQSPPLARISGSVVDSGTPYLQPLSDARVELIRPSGSPMVLRTDPTGRFAFSELSSGRYRISVTRDGYQRKSAPVELTSGQQRGDIVLGLDLAPTLFGHVRDPYNVPIANVIVEAIKVVYGPRGDRSVASVESALTDDRGEYHLYWLDPGEYYIRASPLVLKPGAAVPGNPPSDAQPLTYAPTYYPGSADPKDAAPIRLRVGSNLSALDFRLELMTSVGIAGNISILSTGEPVGTAIVATPAGASASVQKYEGRSVAPGPTVPFRNWGEFGLTGMPPGTYIVSAGYLFGGQQLTVHRKITLKALERGVTLKLIPGSSVKGMVVMGSGPAVDLRTVHVSLESVDSIMPSPEITSVDAKGQFVVSRVEPGDYALRLSNLPGDLYLKSAHSGNVDIQAKPLRLEYESPAPLRVVLGVDGGKLDGLVLDGVNHPFAGADVVLVPDAARRSSPDQYRVTTSAADGRFTLIGIPPGDYRLFAWQGIEANAYMNDVYMTGYEPLGVPMTIAPGSVGNISARLIPMD